MVPCTAFFRGNKILIWIVFVVLGAIRDLVKTIYVHQTNVSQKLKDLAWASHKTCHRKAKGLLF